MVPKLSLWAPLRVAREIRNFVSDPKPEIFHHISNVSLFQSYEYDIDRRLSMAARKLIVGLNPALQRRVELKAPLQLGGVNRVVSSSEGWGGKGQDCAIATAILAEDASSGAVLCQFLGRGAAGDALQCLLEASGVEVETPEALTVRTDGPLRVATTYVSAADVDGIATEVVGAASAVTTEDCARMTALVHTCVTRTGRVGAVVVMGSSPPGVDESFVGSLIAAALRDGGSGKVVLDSVAALHSNLAACAALGASAVLKVNADELLALAENKSAIVTAHAGVDDQCSPRERRCCEAARVLLGAGSAALRHVAVTDGARPGLLFSRSADMGLQLWRVTLPTLSSLGLRVRNPIGAGDAVAAGFTAHWCEDCDIVAAFAFGLACGAASCCTARNSVFDVEVARALSEGAQVAGLGLASTSST